MELQKRGAAVLTIVTQPFASLGRATARSMGMEKLPIIEVPWPFDAEDADKAVQEVLKVMAQAPTAKA
ncbi:MAG: hypothetical protein ABIH46_04315 [Chloroflexota bacterium]